MKKKTQTKLYFTKSACFIITYLFILVNSPTLLSGQNEIIKENFTYPDMTVTTYPQFPAICNPDVGVVVTCNEEFLTYEWQHRNGETESGKVVTLNSTGTWLLTVTKENNGVICTSTINFVVYDLIDPLNIKTYFEEAGFYPIPIWREQLPGIQNGNNNGDRNVVCTLDDVKFQKSVSGVISLSSIINNTLDNFKPIKDLAYSITETNNPCLCELGIEEIENKYISSQVNFWGHQYFASNDSYEGIWYIKMNLPGEEALPIPEQAEHLKEIHPEILSQNDLTNQVRVFISNLIMARPIGGYDPKEYCASSQLSNDYLVTPTGMAIRFNTQVDKVFFYQNGSEDITFKSAFIRADISDKKFRSYYTNLSLLFGYYFDILGDLKIDFEAPTASKVVANFPYICNDVCLDDINQIELKGDQFSDGGINKSIKSDFNFKGIELSFEEINDLLNNIICSAKSGDQSFLCPIIYTGKTLFANNIELGGTKYDIIGIQIFPFISPPPNMFWMDISNSSLNVNNIYKSFKTAIVFNNNYLIRITCFKSRMDCRKLRPVYLNEGNNDYLQLIDESAFNTQKLLNYIRGEGDNKNLLLFVNGYRFKKPKDGLSLGAKAVLNPNKTIHEILENDYETKKAKVFCGDYYNEMGTGYWDNIDNLFIEKIGTNNVYYSDGHASITTSNHSVQNNTILSKYKFIISYLTTLNGLNKKTEFKAAKNLLTLFEPGLQYLIPEWDPNCPYDPHETCVKLNFEPNMNGFDIRYNSGYESGIDLVQQIEDGKVKIRKNAEGKVLGKIDIVCHSMGFAHAVGMADAIISKDILAPNNKLGNFYIIAPENACSAEEFTPNIFDKVWQYGTVEPSLANPNPNRLVQNDGVAPQCGVKGLNWDNPDYARIEFPENSDKLNFFDAHSIISYDWIFKIILIRKGYVKSRK